jgi:serine/threonine-protein kinase
MMQILMGLHVAHEQRDGAGTQLNIVHRDVSPSNLLVSYAGEVKLCDFGIAKARLSRIQTRAGVIKGKVKYMSPEQAMGHKLDRRSDVFSAGAVLYEMLTRQPPFAAESETDLIFRVRDARFTPPGRVKPDLPDELQQIIAHALHRALSARYQTAQEFADDLASYLARRHPDTSPTLLGRFLCGLFAEEIEEDLRLLEEFVVGAVDPEAVGHNLLAEVLGEGATYTTFTPVHPQEGGSGQGRRTRLIPRVPPPEERLPAETDLHEMKTQIIDMDQRDKLVRLRRKRTRPGVGHAQDTRRETQHSTAPAPLPDQTPTDPRPLPPDEEQLESEFHRLPTKIIRVTED